MLNIENMFYSYSYTADSQPYMSFQGYAHKSKGSVAEHAISGLWEALLVATGAPQKHSPAASATAAIDSLKPAGSKSELAIKAAAAPSTTAESRHDNERERGERERERE